MTDFTALAREASVAFTDAEPGLRLLGAVGEIGLGMDPEAPDDTRWWARCETTAITPTGSRPYAANGFPTPKAALDDLRRQLSGPDTGLIFG